MKKSIIILLVALMPLSLFADEGMWLVSTFQNNIYPQMKKLGLKLKPGELYNEEAPAVCSAVVAMNGGMGSGSVISANGLVITNHHVAYSDIHSLSTPEKNYLEDGFWALEAQDELPVKGTTVTFLRKVVDVTEEAQALRKQFMKEGKTGMMSRRIYSTLEKKYGADTPLEVSCSSMWRGEKYLMFFYETYSDVRLVGAPPVRIGAFGGEQDNWGWPQHKGDFALYRVYAGKDGHPAEYSKDNVPLKPRKVLNVATSGIHEKDYAMVIGFPGRTNRYVSSFAVNQKQHVTNPVVVKARRDRLDVMKKHMEADPKVRLQYSDKYFGISNYADFAKWENICLRRYDVVGIRAAEEVKLAKWIEADPARKAEFGNLLENLKKVYNACADPVRAKTYYHETWITPSDVMMTANRVGTLVGRMQRDKVESVQKGDKNFASLDANNRKMMKNFNLELDKDVLVKSMQSFVENVSRDLWGELFCAMYDKYNGDVKAMIDYAFANTYCTNPEAMSKWFETPRTAEELLTDPMVAIAYSVSSTTFRNKLSAAEQSVGGIDPDREEVRYTKALYKMRDAEGTAQYPDANSTMRITYGSVGPISPADGVHYDYRTTINGYVEKYNPEDYEFRVDERMRSLIAAKDWGRWSENGQLYVDFLTNNDITGGNSGSPVLNANGDVIGLAFDGNRESMSGDAYYHPTNFKTVCVDIRFVLWIMDKYAGAGKLIEEINLVK